MKSKHRILAVASAVALLGAITPAAALDINLGGDGASVTDGPAGSNSLVTVGGGDGNVASIGGGAGDQSATVAITNNDGNLVDLGQGDGATNGTVNLGTGGLDLAGLGLGGLDLGGLDLGGLVPGGGGAGGPGGAGGANGEAAARVNAAFSGMSGGQQQALRVRCQSILSSPAAFDTSLVALCRMIERI